MESYREKIDIRREKNDIRREKNDTLGYFFEPAVADCYVIR